MTIAETHRAFKLELDKTSALELPSFEPEEIDFWLNNGIRKFVKTRHAEFEKGIKRIEDLKTLIVDATITGASLTLDALRTGVYWASLASLTTKWFTLGEEVDIRYIKLGESGYTVKRQGVTECTIDTYRSHIDDPYSEHRLHYEEAKPLRLTYQSSVELVTDGNYTITNYYIRYLRKPAEVSLSLSVSCDLPEHTHDEIVKMAVSMALENIEQPRYQSHLNELNNVE